VELFLFSGLSNGEYRSESGSGGGDECLAEGTVFVVVVAPLTLTLRVVGVGDDLVSSAARLELEEDSSSRMDSCAG